MLSNFLDRHDAVAPVRAFLSLRDGCRLASCSPSLVVPLFSSLTIEVVVSPTGIPTGKELKVEPLCSLARPRFLLKRRNGLLNFEETRRHLVAALTGQKGTETAESLSSSLRVRLLKVFSSQLKREGNSPELLRAVETLVVESGGRCPNTAELKEMKNLQTLVLRGKGAQLGMRANLNPSRLPNLRRLAIQFGVEDEKTAAKNSGGAYDLPGVHETCSALAVFRRRHRDKRRAVTSLRVSGSTPGLVPSAATFLSIEIPHLCVTNCKIWDWKGGSLFSTCLSDALPRTTDRQVTHAEILSFFASDKEDGDVEDVGEDEKKGDGGEDEEDEGDFEEDEEDAENEGGFEEDEEDAEDEGEFEEDEEDAEDEGDFKEDEEDGKDEGGLEVDEEDGKDEGGLEVDEEVVDDQIELNIDNGEESEYVPSVSSGDDDLNFDSELEEK